MLASLDEISPPKKRQKVMLYLPLHSLCELKLLDMRLFGYSCRIIFNEIIFFKVLSSLFCYKYSIMRKVMLLKTIKDSCNIFRDFPPVLTGCFYYFFY